MAERPTFTHKRDRHGLVGPFGGRQIAVGLIAVLALAVGLLIVTRPLGSVDPGVDDPRATQFVLDPNAQIGVRPGQIAPELEVPLGDGTTYRLTDLEGNVVRLADLRGKGVWLNFWASWCPPCQAETPVLRDLADRYEDQGLVVIGISVQETTAGDVGRYAERYQLGYTIAPDLSGHIYRLYRPPGLPTQIFIGPDGAVRSFVLAPLTETAAIAQIEAILPDGAGTAASPSPGTSPE